MSDVAVIHGDMRDVLGKMIAERKIVQSVVTDPPYHLTSGNVATDWSSFKTDKGVTNRSGRGHKTGFMGKQWDGGDIAFLPGTWRLCFDLLPPGGHLLAFSGTRTYHRMAVAIEEAGFEMRDTIAWLYGCLDEQTEVVTRGGVKPHHKTKIGDLVLCYDASKGGYSYQPILEIVEYEYSDTAYRLVGDFGEQVVTRNHRCIVEQDGKEVFRFAEEIARERKARVPILESLPELQQAVSGHDQGASNSEESLFNGLRQYDDWNGQRGIDTTAHAQEEGTSGMFRVRESDVAECQMAEEGNDASLLLSMQRPATRRGVGATCPQGTRQLDAGFGGSAYPANDWADQSGMAGRANLPQSQGQVCRPGDQIRPLSDAIPVDGTPRRLRDGASSGRGADTGPAIDADRNGASSQSRRDREQCKEPDAVRDECGTQIIRAWRGHKAAVVRVVPFHHSGKVWCLRVPTGAFVAVRGGVAFPTGNSGFPKSHSVSKAIDRAAGAEREVVGVNTAAIRNKERNTTWTGDVWGDNGATITAPATDAARQWDGWGTALKPAMELICVARKPLIGTIAANVLKHGTGALNIDGCRVPFDGEDTRRKPVPSAGWCIASPTSGSMDDSALNGRWPANVIHDGSDEVVKAFPDRDGATSNSATNSEQSVALGKYGPQERTLGRADTGSAARFFYSARPDDEKRFWYGSKADADDRLASRHPTIKPTDLLRWLVRLVTPPGGTVLDCFAGSGATGMACMAEGFDCIMVEAEAEYVKDIQDRIAHVHGEDTPLFSGVML